jgi:U5 small nuclear ribonucleoprotein component
MFLGDHVGQDFEEIKKARKEGPTVVHVTKQFHDANCENFYLFGRVFSGTLKKDEELLMITEKFSLKDPEHRFLIRIPELFIYNTRYKVKVDAIPAGNMVLIGGLGQYSSKFSTFFPKALSSMFSKPFQVKFPTISPIKLALEPLNPSDLPKMLEGLRKCCKSYPLLDLKMYETGEHMIFGTSELYLDCVLHDLRNLYSDIEVKLSDPSVILTETVIDTSSFKAFSQTPNGMNRLSFIAEPLEAELASSIQSGKLIITDKNLSEKLEQDYSWDILASQNLWAFGAEDNGPNVLINDILPYEVDPSLFSSKSSIVQGFQWACREGPLCDEPMRGVKFRMIEATLAKEGLYKAPGQLIPVTRRVCYSSFLLATPRLMEPYYLFEVLCTKDCIPAVYTLLQRRRGQVRSEQPKPGSPFYVMLASVPVVDSFGFETDLRTYTSGMAFSVGVFDNWALVPGDPLDRKILLKPLEPSPAPALARDFMVKTRNRKGLTEDVVVSKYFDHPALYEMAKADQDLAPYFN